MLSSESHRGVAWMQNTPTHMFILHCNGIHDGDFAVNLEVVISFSYTTTNIVWGCIEIVGKEVRRR